MILVFFFASVILSCLPFIQSATEPNSSMPICPESFSCPNLTPLKYPFYNVIDSRCRLIKVNCTRNGGELQLGGHSYEIGSQYGSGPWFSVRNRTFERLINASDCEALMDNFTSPSPLLYSLSVLPFITLYKCSNYSDDTAQMDAYFDQLSNYHRYNICQNHNFYYNYSISDTTVPSDLPPTCQVIQLPVKLRQPDDSKVLKETNIFSLLTSVYSIYFTSASCNKCGKEPGWCGRQCFEPKKVAAEKPHRKLILILALCIGLVTSLVLIILCFIRKLRWKIKTKKHLNVESFLENHEFLAKRYSYMQVKKMTNSFEVKLGQGGFGSVYKGTLSNGRLVAVKILSELKGNGEGFINEVASVGRTSHVNIVSLVGFCFEGHQRALIYEFMPNGSLEKFIYDKNFLSNSQLGWKNLHEIAIGIARGLEYLHSGCNTRILHFDIKPHNILLDHEFCPKISDFGLAKLFPEKRSMISVSCMRGTPGYIAPELFSRSFGQVSHK